MTGWGHDGPAAPTGHDINYLALTGALHAIGPAECPVPPINYVGDFGGGSMLLVTGILTALLARERSGRGDVIDAAIVDGTALLTQHTHEMVEDGAWDEPEALAANLLDGAAPFYRCYPCADGRFVAVGAIEPQFYTALLTGLGLNAADLPDQLDRGRWPELADRLTAVFARDTRDAGAARFEGSDACVTPVLTFSEAARHPHMVTRGTLSEEDGAVVASPAPRLASVRDKTHGPGAVS
jgi:alpha-methylacyl-CoA racemase